MSAFTVEFENRSGELARLCEAMVAPGVNSVVCAAAHGDTGTVAIIADDGEECQDALEGADIDSTSVHPHYPHRNVAGPVRRLFGSSPMLESTSICSLVRVSSRGVFRPRFVPSISAAASALGDQIVRDYG